MQEERAIVVPEHGTVSSLFLRPPDARAMLVLAHGAGAGMRHPFMENMARQLAAHAVATLRYQFPYMERGQKRPDHPRVATAAVRAALAAAQEAARDLPLFMGGKSFGGRMTSTAHAEAPLAQVCGLVFLGFPLHAPGRAGVGRAAHLAGIMVPMLFVQGTRDALADLSLLRPVVAGLNDGTLYVVADGDHSLALPKRAGREADTVLREIAAETARWMGDRARARSAGQR